MAAPEQSIIGVCASCGERLAGRFCSQCGEERLDLHSLTVGHFLTHAVHEVFELDGKIWRTLRGLVFRPGFLPLEYCAGRRRRYINPFRLLITAAIVYALSTSGGIQIAATVGPVVLSLAPAAVKEGTSIEETVKRVDRFHLLGGMLAGRKEAEGPEGEMAREKFRERLEKFAEPLSFANVLLLALTLQVLFCRKRAHFVEHGVFSMHFMSFALFTGVLFLPAPRLMAAGMVYRVLAAVAAIMLWQFLYLVSAIRRFYFGAAKGAGSWALSMAAAVVVYALNSVFITGVQTLGAAAALAMMGR
jgi:hypothetical protein